MQMLIHAKISVYIINKTGVLFVIQANATQYKLQDQQITCIFCSFRNISWQLIGYLLSVIISVKDTD